jgi:hypothetical protein
MSRLYHPLDSHSFTCPCSHFGAWKVFPWLLQPLLHGNSSYLRPPISTLLIFSGTWRHCLSIGTAIVPINLLFASDQRQDPIAKRDGETEGRRDGGIIDFGFHLSLSFSLSLCPSAWRLTEQSDNNFQQDRARIFESSRLTFRLYEIGLIGLICWSYRSYESYKSYSFSQENKPCYRKARR